MENNGNFFQATAWWKIIKYTIELCKTRNSLGI